MRPNTVMLYEGLPLCSRDDTSVRGDIGVCYDGRSVMASPRHGPVLSHGGGYEGTSKRSTLSYHGLVSPVTSVFRGSFISSP